MNSECLKKLECICQDQMKEGWLDYSEIPGTHRSKAIISKVTDARQCVLHLLKS